LLENVLLQGGVNIKDEIDYFEMAIDLF